MKSIAHKGNKPVSISPDTEEFLRAILAPEAVTIHAPIATFISNLVKEEVWRKVQNAKAKGTY